MPHCLCLSQTYKLVFQMGKVIEQKENFYPELKIAYAVQGNKLGTRVRDQGAPYPWYNSGLVLQAQVH